MRLPPWLLLATCPCACGRSEPPKPPPVPRVIQWTSRVTDGLASAKSLKKPVFLDFMSPT